MRKVHLGGKAGRSSALDSLTLWSKMRVLVLLSPAKTLNWAPSPAFLSEIWTQPKLLKEADPVIEVMRGKNKADLKKLMSVSDNIADLNLERFKKFLGSAKVEQGPPTAELAADIARPAALAYDGPAYRGLDAASFSEEDWAFGAGSVRLLSGLYGVLRPTDLIQPYRLEMGSRVGVSGKKDLYEYWKSDIARCLLHDVQDNGTAKETSDGFLVVNVASQEYSKAVDFSCLESEGGKVITCVFKDDGRVLSVFAKRARGLLARHVVVNRAEGIADLEAFSAEGYRLDRSQSADGMLVFTRTKAQRVGPTKSAAGKKSQAKPTKKKAGAQEEEEEDDKGGKPAGRRGGKAGAAGGGKRATSARAARAAEKLEEKKEGEGGGGGDCTGGASKARAKRAAPSVAKKSATKSKRKKA